jgi:2-phospho-L-lactate guanylyltransferase
MTDAGDIWAVVPVKDTAAAKTRLAPALPAELRQGLALAMLEDVLAALAEARGLAGRLLVTIDPAACDLASRYETHCIEDGSRDGHTGAVTAAARRLTVERHGAMLTLPGDIPLVTAVEIEHLIAAHRETSRWPAPSFTIAPSHDEMGSNAIIVSPPEAVPLRFGDDSFRPHLAAAHAAGIEPTVVKLPGIALDIDNPADLAHFSQLGSRTRAGLWLARNARALASAGFAPSPGPGTRLPS